MINFNMIIIIIDCVTNQLKAKYTFELNLS
jgi:hypothetical protein